LPGWLSTSSRPPIAATSARRSPARDRCRRTRASSRVHLLEGLEDPLLLVRRNADSGVRDHEAQRPLSPLRLDRLDLDQHLAVAGELDRVADQVDDHLPQPRGVAHHERRHPRRDPRDELEALLMRAHPERAQRVAQHVAHVERCRGQLELAGLDAREVEQVADQAEQRLGRLLERAHVLALHAAQRRVEQQLGHPDHRVHRGADLVAHVREEVALRAARRLGRLARRVQLLPRPLSARSRRAPRSR
jgi:hypothetical protein